MGVDIALHCKGDMAEMVEGAGAAGVMGPEALVRAEAAVAARRPGSVDVAAALAELAHG